MAHALIQDDVGAVVDGGTLAFGSNVVAGNALFALVTFANGTAEVTTLTDSQGNTWARAVQRGGVSAFSAEIWYARAVASAACTLTFDYNQTITAQVCVAEIDGFSGGIVVDQTNSNYDNGGSTTLSHGEITTTQDTSVTLATARIDSGFTLSSRGDSFSALTNQSRSVNSYKATTSTETHDCELTFATAELGALAIANFYDTGGGGGGSTLRPKRRMLMGIG